MPSKAALRRARRARRASELADAALAITCPACGANPGIWCFWRRALGPDMHERRYAAATRRES